MTSGFQLQEIARKQGVAQLEVIDSEARGIDVGHMATPTEA